MVAAPALAAMLAWSILVEPASLIVRKVIVKTAKWPAAATPLRMAVIADLHVGSPFNGLDALDRLVARVNRLRPDVVLLLGDYVIHGVAFGSFVSPGTIAERLGRLRAPHGVIAILGNHDYMYGGARVRRHLEDAGIIVLEDQVHPIDTAGGRIWFAGLKDGVSGSPDTKGTIAKASAAEPVIVLSHDPAVFKDVPERGFLTLAGHTHGGQINLPFINPLTTPGRALVKYERGAYRDGKKLMYISAGIGTSILPARFNMRPELLIVSLKNSTTVEPQN